MNNDHSLKLGFIQTIYDIHKNYSSSSGEAFLKKDYKRYFKSFYITVTFAHILYLWKPCYVCSRQGLSLGEQIIYMDFEGGKLVVWLVLN